MIGTRTWVTRSTNKTTNKQTRKKGELQVHQRASKPGNRLSINKMHIFDPIWIGAVCLSWLIVNNSRVKARRWFIRSYCFERYEHRIRLNQAGSCRNCGQKRRAGNSFFSFLDEASWQCRCPSRSQYLNISNWTVSFYSWHKNASLRCMIVSLLKIRCPAQVSLGGSVFSSHLSWHVVPSHLLVLSKVSMNRESSQIRTSNAK